MWLGSRSRNSECHPAYGPRNVTSTVRPPPLTSTLSMRSYPDGSATPGLDTIMSRRYWKSDPVMGVPSDHCACGVIS